MKNNVRHNKRVRKLIVLTFLCAMILGVSTYAWFIGMKTVNVSSFNVKIATTEGLYISMDGKSWAYNLDIDNASTPDVNTNKIENVELIPVSTIGEMDASSSTMIMYEKGSLTPMTNGYRLLASKVHNYIDPDDETGLTYTELDTNKKVGNENPNVAKTGYVAFDLYIKNVSGEEYYVENNVENEEAIYLTTNSKVTVATGGSTDTGIENSVRVAFAQIGRMEDVTTNYPNAYKITCETEEAAKANESITGICRDAYIWEPNDTKHVPNAISWYNTSSGKNDLVNGEYFSTSAIKAEIKDVYNVNVYSRATDTGMDEYLKDMVYFTDTDKVQSGINRKQFMTLAPNSITKIRVYVYLEGQDVDNYDFAQLGKQISVNFGFTKERFQETDIDYTGPNTYITPDTTTPVPNINGSEIENGLSNGVTDQYENSASVPEYAYR